MILGLCFDTICPLLAETKNAIRSGGLPFDTKSVSDRPSLAALSTAERQNNDQWEIFRLEEKCAIRLFSWWGDAVLCESSDRRITQAETNSPASAHHQHPRSRPANRGLGKELAIVKVVVGWRRRMSKAIMYQAPAIRPHC